MAKPSMPRSCGLALRTLRTREKLESDTLTEVLRPHTKRFKPQKNKFSADTITRAEHSQETLYWLLDAYAKWSGYPVGLIYLFARISSELRDSNFDAAKAIAAALRTLARFIDDAGPDNVARLEPVVFSDQGVPERPEDELDGIAYDTVIRYQQHLPRDHPEYEEQLKYTDSQQFINDARQVRILLELLSKVAPPLKPAGDVENPGTD